MSKKYKVAFVFPTDKFPLKKRKYCMVPNSIGFSFLRFFPSETLFCSDSSNLYLLYSYIKPKTRNTSAMEKALGTGQERMRIAIYIRKGRKCHKLILLAVMVVILCLSKAKRNMTFHFSQSMDIFDADIDELLSDSS